MIGRFYKKKMNEIVFNNQGGRTALHYAAKNGHIEIVKYLIDEHGVDVNIQDKVSDE